MAAIEGSPPQVPLCKHAVELPALSRSSIHNREDECVFSAVQAAKRRPGMSRKTEPAHSITRFVRSKLGTFRNLSSLLDSRQRAGMLGTLNERNAPPVREAASRSSRVRFDRQAGDRQSQAGIIRAPSRALQCAREGGPECDFASVLLVVRRLGADQGVGTMVSLVPRPMVGGLAERPRACARVPPPSWAIRSV